MALLLRQLSKYEPLKWKNAKPVFQNGGMAVIRIVMGVSGKNSLEFIDNMIAD